MEADTVRAAWSVVWSSHAEPGKVEFERGPPLWSACNTEDLFTSVNSSSFSIVLEADFCQCFCNSVAAVRQWWISPPFLVSVPLWDEPGDVPSLLQYPNTGYEWWYFNMAAHCNLWKRWQIAALLEKTRRNQKGKTKPSAFYPLNTMANSDPSVTLNSSEVTLIWWNWSLAVSWKPFTIRCSLLDPYYYHWYIQRLSYYLSFHTQDISDSGQDLILPSITALAWWFSIHPESMES